MFATSVTLAHRSSLLGDLDADADFHETTGLR
jgi:hypothetical protein